ncbi:putative aminoacyltransferase, E1 ubiquitin-activating enzyme [Medicago truncatula]|uniref:Putative aminoacyltransferase, E1 ubiquitin-activating enzyme n=1 Tax=Medicago truncatula TaxID=3880 RepID=A0A396IA03_MEDTR|nr:putative aminoacyltransferase, E1 ubiquitin-activating enzyme [Medicago truncatula]
MSLPSRMENDDDYSSIVDDDDDYSPIAEDDNHFSVLNESDIKHLQNNGINHILSVLSTSRSTACLLLTNYNWNVPQALESWFDNPQKVQKTIGLSNQPHLELGFPNSSQTLTMCHICFETFASDKIKSSWCGHPFCINCWNQYVDINIDDLNCFKLRCPQPSCNAAVDQDMIHQLASNFCWNCGEEAHTPVDCETFVKWRRKISSDSEVTNNSWIIANTKPCPNCKIAIEKNQGCRHMRCRLCKFSFCWLCLRDMSICIKNGCSGTLNNVQVWHSHQEIYDDEMLRTNAKNCLDKYTYYEILRKKALQNLIEMNSTAYICWPHHVWVLFPAKDNYYK